MAEISVVVVSYRTPDLLRTCLTRLVADPGVREREIIVVDNASGDESADVARSFPGVAVVESEENLGFGGGVNRGLAAARGRYVFIMNPDVEVRPGAIDVLARYLDAHPETGIAAPKLLNTDGSLQHSCRRQYTLQTIVLRRTFLGRLFPHAPPLRRHLMMDYDHAAPRAVDWVAGAAMMARREAVDDVGPMEERYFLYFEDVDWCTRMQARGWAVHYVPEAVMIHHWQRASRGFGPATRRHIRSGLRFYDRWGGVLYVLRQNLPLWRTLFLVAGDLAAFSLAFLAAFGLRQQLAFALHKPLWAFSFYRGFFAASVLVNTAVMSRIGLHREIKKGDWIDVAFRISRGTAVAALVLMASTFILEMRGYSRLIVLASWPLAALFAFGMRRLFHAAFAQARRDRWNLRRLALLGEGKLLDRLEAELRSKPELGWDPVRLRRRPWEGLPADEVMPALVRLLVAERISNVVVSPESFDVAEEDLPAVVLPLRRAGFGVRLLSPFLASLPTHARVEGGGTISWLSLERPTLGPDSHVKRVLDVVLASGFAVVGGIPALAVVVVRGISGKRIREPEERIRGRWGDIHRIHRLAGGGWLRWYPLLRLVVRGELSLVGPRPLRADESVPGGEAWLRVRESHRPGLVGLWTLAPPRIPLEEREQELRYLDEWSPELDLKILVRAALRRPRPPADTGEANPARTASVLTLLVLLAAAPLHAQSLGEAVTPYVSANDLYDMASDGNGNLWIASHGGALRFDMANESWTVFTRDVGSGPRGNDLSSVCVDTSGRVWVGSASQGFTFYDPGTGIWDRQSEEWPDPRIRVIRCLGGGIYIGTQNGLSLKPTPSRTDICSDADPGCIVPSYVVNDYALMGDTLWVATDRGLGRFNGATWDSASALPSGSTGQNSTSLAVYQGWLWEVNATLGRIRRLHNGVWDSFFPTTYRLAVKEGTLYALSTYQVYSWNGSAFENLNVPLTTDAVVRDIEVFGDEYYLALNTGLARWNRTTGAIDYFIPPGPALSGVYSGVAVDASGTLWAGTSERRIGMVKRQGSVWSLIDPDVAGGGLGDGWILGMHSSVGNEVWIGHCCCPTPADCPLQVELDGGYTTFPAVLNVRSFAVDPAGRLWGGSQGNGLYVLGRDSGTGEYAPILNLTTQNTGGVMASNSVRALAVTSRYAYIGHEQDGLDLWPYSSDLSRGSDGSNWHHIGAGSILLDGAVGAMAVMGDQVWVGTATGIHRFDGSVLIERCPTRLRDDPTDLPRKVNSMVGDRNGGLWIATDRDLLYLPRGAACDDNGGDFRVFSMASASIPNDRVIAAAADPKDGSVWFGTPDGIFRVDPARVPGTPGESDAFVLYPNPLYPSSGNAALRRVILGVRTGSTGVAPVPVEDVDPPEVFDLVGRKVGSFIADPSVAGGAWVWYGTNVNGDTVAPGVFLVRTVASDGTAVVLRVGVLR